LANESILPMARNELLNLAYHEKYDTVVFIDDDEYLKDAYYTYPIYIMLVSRDRYAAYVNVLTCEDIQLLKDAIGVNNEEV